MRQTIGMIIAAIVFIAGACAVAYPFVSDWLAAQERGAVIWQQQDAVRGTDDSVVAMQMQAALDYNAALRSGAQVSDPFGDASTEGESGDAYDRLLNIRGDGVMATLYIPAIDIQMPVYHGTTDEVLAKGVGHVYGTALPVGGFSTHCVLSGHNGLPSTKIFDALDQVKVGDYFIVDVLGEYHAYRVYGIEIVLPEDLNFSHVEEGRDLMTLVTCTPYGVNTHRLLVHAERCDVPQEWLDRDKEQDSGLAIPLREHATVVAGVAAAIVLVVVVAVIIVVRRRKKPQER